MTDTQIDYFSLIIGEFSEVSKQARGNKSKGWQFRVKNYDRVCSLLKLAQAQHLENPEFYPQPKDTNCILLLLREAGMKFTGDEPRKTDTKTTPWKSKILTKMDDIFRLGYLPQAQKSREDPKTKAIHLLSQLPEIGPSKANQLYEKGITSPQELLTKLETDSELINRKQKIGLRHFQDLAKRIPREEMHRWKEFLTLIVEDIMKIYNISDYKCEIVGSYRRECNDSGDVDFFLSLPDYVSEETTSEIMKEIQDELIRIGSLQPDDTFSCGSHKLMCVAKIGPQTTARHLDIFLFKQSQWAFAILHATGCGEFNVRLRNHAITLGWSLSEKGLSPTNKVKSPKIVTKPTLTFFNKEEDIFHFLGLEMIQPRDRHSNAKFTLIHNLDED